MDQESQWQEILSLVKSQITALNFRNLITGTKLVEINKDRLVLAVPNAFRKNEIIKRYDTLIHEALKNTFGQEVKLEFQIQQELLIQEEEIAPDDEERMPVISAPPRAPQISPLNPRYTLENFVVGMTNNLAFAAAQAVITQPGTTYNPLFIYGPSGVGKTHLMQGVGNALLMKNPQLKILSFPFERFMVDFVDSIKTNSMIDFRKKYRACHLLLVDDIQFISGKDSTQEEFFHTFNELYGRGVQVILTSDRTPNEIEKLEPRLASRFQGGLMVDMQLPDFETRMAILKTKLQERHEFLPDEILTLIAEQIQSTRELEGTLTKIVQKLRTDNLEPTIENVTAILGSGPQQQKTTQFKDHKKVLHEINQYFQIKMADLTGPKRQKQLVIPRQIAMYILYTECQIPFERIGQILGGRDHTTIMHGVDKIKEALTRDREIERLLVEVRRSIAN